MLDGQIVLAVHPPDRAGSLNQHRRQHLLPCRFPAGLCLLADSFIAGTSPVAARGATAVSRDMSAPVSATKTCATFSQPGDGLQQPDFGAAGASRPRREPHPARPKPAPPSCGFVLDQLRVEVLVGYRNAQHVESKRVLRLMGEAHLQGGPHHLPEGSGSRGWELLHATQEALKLVPPALTRRCSLGPPGGGTLDREAEL